MSDALTKAYTSMAAPTTPQDVATTKVDKKVELFQAHGKKY